MILAAKSAASPVYRPRRIRSMILPRTCPCSRWTWAFVRLGEGIDRCDQHAGRGFRHGAPEPGELAGIRHSVIRKQADSAAPSRVRVRRRWGRRRDRRGAKDRGIFPASRRRRGPARHRARRAQSSAIFESPPGFGRRPQRRRRAAERGWPRSARRPSPRRVPPGASRTARRVFPPHPSPRRSRQSRRDARAARYRLPGGRGQSGHCYRPRFQQVEPLRHAGDMVSIHCHVLGVEPSFRTRKPW